MATIDVLDTQTNQVLVSQDVQAKDMICGNDWTIISLNFTVTSSDNRLEFRTYWHGTADMDIAVVRVWKP